MTEITVGCRAIQEIGTPFRLHGRCPGVALDCVGLIAHCTNQIGNNNELPRDYRLRGAHHGAIKDYFAQSHFQTVEPAQLETGDICAVDCAPRQSHLMIRVKGGWVHAHAGLGRVVFTPDPVAWPIWGAWRLKKD